MKERMLAEFPALRVEKHPVPDDQNGFLMLFQLDDLIKNLNPPLSEDFRQLLNGTTPWDADAMARASPSTKDRFAKIYAASSLRS